VTTGQPAKPIDDFARARALSDSGRHAEAEALLRAALRTRKRDFRLTNLLGIVLRRSGRTAEAILMFEAARRLDPKSASPLVNLANTHMAAHDGKKAAQAALLATRLDPKRAGNWHLLGQAQRLAGQGGEAVRSLSRALVLDPSHVEAVIDLAGTHLDLGRTEQAMGVVVEALQRLPDNGRLRAVEVRLLLQAGLVDAAKAKIAAVLEAEPGNLDALLAAARIAGRADRRGANAYLQRAVEAHPTSVEAALQLCDSLNRSRHDDEAAHIEAAYRIAARLADARATGGPRGAETLRSVLCRCVDFERLEATGRLADLAPGWIAQGKVTPLHYELGRARSLEDRLALVEWHRAWGRKVEAAIRPLNPAPPAAPAVITGRRIRVGFMSSDLRHHPVSYFALPLLELHDRARFDLRCYSFYEGAADRVQTLIASKVDAFNWWPRRPDAQVAEGIAADDLDVLFDLGGGTDMNKLQVMAYRPAAIGVSWLGYPHSAGLERIDRLLVDPYIKPAPGLMIEQPFELPHSWVTLGRLGFHDEPMADTLPEERAGRLTFGSMNNPYKYTPAMLDAWAKVILAVPGSRFLFVRPEGAVPAFRRNVEAELARRGVDPDRIAYTPVRGTHLRHYNDIDVALDSFPHVGGTTTCEALWMGVPTITLVGPAFFERLSYSNLSNAGLGELCAFSAEEYVAKAVELAEDQPRRRMLRQGMRARIRQNPLGQVERFVQDFYGAVAKLVS